MYEKSQYGIFTDTLWIVSIGNFAQQVADQYLEIQVPGNDTIRSYRAKFVEAKPNGTITWFGETSVSLNHWGYGYASFVLENGDLIGYFTTETDNYSLRPIGEGLYVLVRYAD